ncbi:hypothetical protein LHJ74_23635 [Streptomyces sp. N2-109]|uniref:Integral membrane protein n=1 Tax=Streptomyces gossypii TaxID=2883101 RepID=A0ABT2K085_9ACTN|nr:hypothetical protein [Streptomyces gossypii]MCT2592869.1 hypothetical protein [Streptomyces gossypii]
MTKFLLSVHVLAAILAIGPVAVAASMFPAAVRRSHPAAGAPDNAPAGAAVDGAPAEAAAAVRTLHRICRVYAVVGVVVPVFGLATASSLGVLGDAWLIASIVLTTLAAAVLVVFVLPGQEAAVAELDGEVTAPAAPASARAARLAMHTGVFNLLWATVTVLMIVRPGSTTGA